MQNPGTVERAQHWHLFGPPSRLSAGEVARYDRFARVHGSGAERWAILGCTPELRSLAGAHGHAVVCVDRNPGVFGALRAYVTGDPCERFVCSDWLALQLSDPADVVFADGSLNMLPPDGHDCFVASLAAAVRPGGRALVRVHLAEAPEFLDAAAVFEWFRGRGTAEAVFTATRTHLDMLWLEPETLRISFMAYHARIRELYEDHLITAEELEAYDRLQCFDRIDLWYTTADRFARQVTPWFTIERIACGGDYTGTRQHPVYVLRRRHG
jgi:SAM-dependent methyltransferase